MQWPNRMVAGVKRMWEFCGVRVQGGGVGARQLPLGQGCPGDAPRVMDDNTCHAMPITATLDCETGPGECANAGFKSLGAPVQKLWGAPLSERKAASTILSNFVQELLKIGFPISDPKFS